MQTALPPHRFVSTAWLAARLDDPALAIVDGSWHIPTTGRNGREEYARTHIPGAVFLDIDVVADLEAGLPHMMPTPDAFAQAVGALGIAETMTIIVYDGAGLFSAPRVAWMFRAFGAESVFILEGGLPRWQAEGRPVTDADSMRPARTFHARAAGAVIAAVGDVEAAIATGAAQVVDGRPGARFRAEAPEPRPGLRAGHIPGSLSLPFQDVVREGALLPPDELRAAISTAGIDPTRPVITTCGSGVAAALIGLAMEVAGQPEPKIYDGAYTEWASDPSRPVETGGR